MPDPGDVVTVDFPGAMGIKRRPAVVLSSATYHAYRPDVILGIITSQIAAATTPLDCQLQDWAAVGLRRPSAFRAYLGMAETNGIRIIGHLSEPNWRTVRECVTAALAM